jgi:hypothetical protein
MILSSRLAWVSDLRKIVNAGADASHLESYLLGRLRSGGWRFKTRK